ncbi:MAG: hypothetical protein KDA60_05975, partial [Planctomycetales bacterium]|nr:hypothetical protein [Planctomycetales bacterium]
NETAFMGVACVLAQSYLMYATLGYRVLLPEIFGAEVKTLRANSSLLTYATGYLLACGGLALATAWVAICIFLPVGYRAAFWPTNLLLVAAMIGGLSMIARAYLLAFQDELSILLGYGAGALLFLAVGIPATREFAFWGTAMTAVLSMSVGLAVMAWRLWRHWSPADVPTSHGMIE